MRLALAITHVTKLPDSEYRNYMNNEDFKEK